MTAVHLNPHVYVVDGFLNSRQCNAICKLHTSEASRSFVDGEQDAFISDDRTSTYTTLPETHTYTAKILHKAEKLAKSLFHSRVVAKELPQIIKYTPGQKFDIHHDSGSVYEDGTVHALPQDPPGFRHISIFVYLMTPRLGGRTIFPQCNNLRVRPVQGRAVIWCNRTKEGNLDPKVCHAGEVVKRGTKMGMNIWLDLE